MRTFLFVRKNKDDKDSKEFYFLGTMHPTQSYRAFTMPNTNKQAVEIATSSTRRCATTFYAYLTSSRLSKAGRRCPSATCARGRQAR